MDLQEDVKKVLLYQFLTFNIHGKTLKAHATIMNLKIRFNVNDNFELTDASYSVSDIQDHFEYN